MVGPTGFESVCRLIFPLILLGFVGLFYFGGGLVALSARPHPEKAIAVGGAVGARERANPIHEVATGFKNDVYRAVGVGGDDDGG